MFGHLHKIYEKDIYGIRFSQGFPRKKRKGIFNQTAYFIKNFVTTQHGQEKFFSNENGFGTHKLAFREKYDLATLSNSLKFIPANNSVGYSKVRIMGAY